MRYRDLITILFIVATASWLWAEPSQQVRVPTSQSKISTEGWTIPELDLSESSRRIVESAKKVPEVEPARGEPQLSWSDFDTEDFRLSVSVDPGKDLSSTFFDVSFRGPQGFDLIRDGRSDAQFMVSFGDSFSNTLFVRQVHRVGPNHWRFQGSDLESIDPERPIDFRLVSQSESFKVSTAMRDERQSRFSRGANMMVLESAPFELSLR